MRTRIRTAALELASRHSTPLARSTHTMRASVLRDLARASATTIASLASTSSRSLASTTPWRAVAVAAARDLPSIVPPQPRDGFTRSYAKAAKKQSKSKASQGKGAKTKGRGPGQATISAKAESTTKGNKDTYLRSVAPVEYEDEQLTAEELAEYEAKAKEYSRRKLRADRAFMADINQKIRIKMAAIDALPAGPVREAALVEDLELFPLKRKMPSWTPAIPGYYEEKQRIAEEAVSSGAALRR